MPTKRKTPNDGIPEGFSLSEILQDVGDSAHLSYGAVDSNTVRRLLHCVGELGGMVTFYVDNTNQRLAFSVRFGNEKKGGGGETPEQFKDACEAFIGKLTPALVRLKKVPPPKPG